MSLEHKQRWIAAVVGVAGLAAIYTFLRHEGLILITVAISFVAYAEFLAFSRSVTTKFSRWSSAAVGALLCAWLSIGLPGALPALYVAALAVSLRSLWKAHLADTGQLHESFLRMQARVFGLVYLAFFPSFVPHLHALPHGPQLLLFLLGIIWLGDTGGYYGGKLFGRNKLSLNISPGKTREGALASFFAVAAFALVLHVYALPHLPWPKMVFIAVATSAIAQAGDLLESLMKRAYSVKDSGDLIPGHGGVFDRFDSLILAAPFFYLLIRLFA